MLYAKLAAALFAIDEYIKCYFEQNGKAGKHLPAFNDKILLTKYHNTGAALNMGSTKQKTMAMISVVFTLSLTLVFVITLGMKGKHTLKTGLAFLLGGAFSNTYDRLTREYVVDYFSINSKNNKIRNVVFNISDFCIIIGSFLLVISDTFKR